MQAISKLENIVKSLVIGSSILVLSSCSNYAGGDLSQYRGMVTLKGEGNAPDFVHNIARFKEKGKTGRLKEYTHDDVGNFTIIYEFSDPNNTEEITKYIIERDGRQTASINFNDIKDKDSIRNSVIKMLEASGYFSE